MLITTSLITFMFERITALESMVNRQADLLLQYADECDRMHTRIEELVSQANAEYAPYREIVHTARDEVNRFAADNECLRDAMIAAQRDERIAQAEIVNLRAENKRLEAALIQARLNCQEIRV